MTEVETEDALARFLDIYADCHNLTALYPGAHELLEALSTAAVELAVVTNKPERFVAPLLEQVDDLEDTDRGSDGFGSTGR